MYDAHACPELGVATFSSTKHLEHELQSLKAPKHGNGLGVLLLLV
jgi:hypothetical protein